MSNVMVAFGGERLQSGLVRRLRGAAANGSMLVAAMVCIVGIEFIRQHYLPTSMGTIEVAPLLALGAGVLALALFLAVAFPNHPTSWTRGIDFIAKMLMVVAMARAGFDLFELGARAVIGQRGCVTGVRNLMELCTVLLIGAMLYDRMRERAAPARR